MIIIIWLILVAAAGWGGYLFGKQRGQEVAGLLLGLLPSLVGGLAAGLLGCVLLGGLGIGIIFALPNKKTGAPSPLSASTASSPPTTLTSRLDELEALHRQGKISDDELKAARARLLGT